MNLSSIRTPAEGKATPVWLGERGNDPVESSFFPTLVGVIIQRNDVRAYSQYCESFKGFRWRPPPQFLVAFGEALFIHIETSTLVGLYSTSLFVWPSSHAALTLPSPVWAKKEQRAAAQHTTRRDRCQTAPDRQLGASPPLLIVIAFLFCCVCTNCFLIIMSVRFPIHLTIFARKGFADVNVDLVVRVERVIFGSS
jgi:hypothetical protein